MATFVLEKKFPKPIVPEIAKYVGTAVVLPEKHKFATLTEQQEAFKL